MHYIPGLIKAVVPAMLTFYVVLAGIYLIVRAVGKTPGAFPVFPKFAFNKKLSHSGTDLEQFVADRFDPGHFRRIIGRQAPASDGADTKELHMPDKPALLFQALVHEEVIPFAVACIWKLRFTGGVLDFSEGNPFTGYRRFSTEQNMPVFIVIAVGGTGNEPHDCYVLPVDAIGADLAVLPKTFLDGYRRTQADAVFFLDINQMTLR